MLKQSKQILAGYQCPTLDDASDTIAITGEYTTVTGDAIGDIVEFGGIPDGAIVTDVIVDNGALGASSTLDCGILSGDYAKKDSTRTMGNEFFAASASVTSGVIRRTKNVNAILTSNVVQGFGVKFLGANPAVGQVIRATIYVRSTPVGML